MTDLVLCIVPTVQWRVPVSTTLPSFLGIAFERWFSIADKPISKNKQIKKRKPEICFPFLLGEQLV